MPTTAFDALEALRDSLVRVLGSDPDLADVTVFDGGPTSDVPFNTLHVGYSEPTGLAVDGREDAMGYSEQRTEVYDLALCAYTQTGDSEQTGAQAARDKARAIYAAVESYVTGDPKLNGTVERAIVGARFRLEQGQRPPGAGTTLQFTVRCLAYV